MEQTPGSDREDTPEEVKAEIKEEQGTDDDDEGNDPFLWGVDPYSSRRCSVSEDEEAVDVREFVKTDFDCESEDTLNQIGKDVWQPEVLPTSSDRLLRRLRRDKCLPAHGEPSAKRKRDSASKPPAPSQLPTCKELRCLLCYKTINPNEVTPSSTNNQDENDFQVMFVLKKMLNMPKESLADYLNHLGQPREWIKFCFTCSHSVNKAVVIQKEIGRLEANLREYQKEMINAIKKSNNANIETPIIGNKDVFRVTTETRNFVITGKYVNHAFLIRHNTSRKDPKRITVPTVAPSRPKKARTRHKSMSSRARRLRIMKSLKARQVESLLGKMPIPKEDSDTGYEGQLEVNLNIPIAPTADEISGNKKTKEVRIRRKKLTAEEAGLSMQDTNCNVLKRTDYNCTSCPDVKNMNFILFTTHMLFHHRRSYKCSDCHAYYSGNVELNKNPISSILNENPEGHACSTLVEEKFKPSQIWGCWHCDQRFDSDVVRDLHEKDCLQGNEKLSIVLKDSCNICKREFRNIAERRLHMVLEHPEVAKTTCYYCNESFIVKTKEDLDLLDFERMRDHLGQHHYHEALDTRMVFTCDYCGKGVWNTVELNDHLQREHKIKKNKTVSCEICHHRHSNRHVLLSHQRNIHFLGEKEKKACYVCETCGYETQNPLKFEHHAFMKHGVEPKERPILKCSEEGCSFQTVGNVNLRKHMMKDHNAPRMHTCQTCGKGFLNGSKLRAHEQIHLNKANKPFQCEICGNSFAVKNYLYIHKRLSHQNRPFASTHKKKPPRKTAKAAKVKATPNAPSEIIQNQLHNCQDNTHHTTAVDTGTYVDMSSMLPNPILSAIVPHEHNIMPLVTQPNNLTLL